MLSRIGSGIIRDCSTVRKALLVDFNPVAARLGPFEVFGQSIGPLLIHWYGLMYLIGFALFWYVGSRRETRPPWNWPKGTVGDLLFYGILGVIIGGRLGYILFYDFAAVMRDPLRAFAIWQGGMSFHGGLLGSIVAAYLFAARNRMSFWEITDFAAPLAPIGLFFGRLGNFIGGELWGRPTDAPWGMVFPKALQAEGWTMESIREAYAKGALDFAHRHPSQLYEAFLEGIILFIALNAYLRSDPPRMALSGAFLLGYGIFRGAVEFVRQPDPQLGYLAFGWLTMGQLLCLPMLLGGLVLLVLAYRRRELRGVAV